MILQYTSFFPSIFWAL